MTINPIWWAISKATDKQLSDFVSDMQLNVAVVPFVGDPGTEDDEGTYTTDELMDFFRDFSREIARGSISEVKT